MIYILVIILLFHNCIIFFSYSDGTSSAQQQASNEATVSDYDVPRKSTTSLCAKVSSLKLLLFRRRLIGNSKSITVTSHGCAISIFTFSGETFF